MKLLTLNDVLQIVGRCTYKPGWTFIVGQDDSRLYIQVHVDKSAGVCSVSKEPVEWKGGKKYLSPYMCKQEIVGVCFAAIKDAEEHEMREWFRYTGVSIFNPHLDPDALAAIAKHKHNYCTRPDNQSMTLEEPRNDRTRIL